MEVYFHSLLTSELEVSGRLHAPTALIQRKEPPVAGAYYTGGWVGSRAALNAFEKTNISRPYQESNHDSLVVQPVTNYAVPVKSAVKSMNGFLEHNYSGTHLATKQQQCRRLYY